MTNEITYDRFGRMHFHPDFHGKHKKPWTNKDEQYLIENYETQGPEAVSLALERTIKTVMTRANVLRNAGKMPKRSVAAKMHKRARYA